MKKLSLSSSSNNHSSLSRPPDPNELFSVPTIKRLRRSIHFKLLDSSEGFLLKRRDKGDEAYSRVPLTERNIETLKCENLGIRQEEQQQLRKEEEDLAFEEEEEDKKERENARHELRRKREVQVSEWLRKLP